MHKRLLLTVLVSGYGVLACGGHGNAPAEEWLNVYNWPDYIARDTIANFERETGIKVRYSTFESNDILATKLLTGRTNFDVVVPSDEYFERELRAGVFRKLNKTALPNSVNLDPDIMRHLAVHDPKNQYAVPYLWATTGIGYNVDKVRERLGSTDFDSWSLALDPKNAAKLQDCGILFVDSATDVLSSVLIYLGKNPNSRDPTDLSAAAEVLMKIRPFVRAIDSVSVIGDLANGSLCLVVGWSGDVMQARSRALEASNGVKLRYIVPREGSSLIADVLAIPADAPHPRNAEKWINYLMRPEVMAGITNAVKFPNANRASLALVEEAIKNDPAIYPDAMTRAKLHTLVPPPPEITRLITRLWTKFRTGQ